MPTVKCYYLRIDSSGVYAYDSVTDKELLAVSGDVERAIDTIKSSLGDARLVGARFP